MTKKTDTEKLQDAADILLANPWTRLPQLFDMFSAMLISRLSEGGFQHKEELKVRKFLVAIGTAILNFKLGK